MNMLKAHAYNHADRIRFPPNQGKDYIIERSKYTKMAYGRLNRNWWNAEDAVQSSYMKILEHPPKTEMTDEQFEAYFTVVLRSVISNSKRNEHQREVNLNDTSGKYVQYLETEEDSDMDDYSRREEIVSLADEDSNPELTALANELLGVIQYEIDRLMFKPRQIVALNVLYGYKPREIHSITGDKPHIIRKIIHRFRETMKEKLG